MPPPTGTPAPVLPPQTVASAAAPDPALEPEGARVLGWRTARAGTAGGQEASRISLNHLVRKAARKTACTAKNAR
ncbi:hypothetical protein SAMN05216499_102533 [Actinacidiphila paucisporea]|uniref:Uncharacterized protein n=1 Tax=Actinacidiphila paucisporea TaxID=310782 RepID=A0A1M6XUJ5_9ACTN|nr:hypothetical protein SAMN05216499_102533 [Actinacidiphila paucisporea]